MKDLRQSTPFNLDMDIWKGLKIQAIIENKKMGKLLEEMIISYLDREGNKKIKGENNAVSKRTGY